MNGLPTGQSDDQMIERLVALEEFRIIKLLKAEAKAEAQSKEQLKIAKQQATEVVKNLLGEKFSELLPAEL